jgi:hypothetical protein
MGCVTTTLLPEGLCARKAELELLNLEKRLKLAADEYAKRRGMGRSELIAEALWRVIGDESRKQE